MAEKVEFYRETEFKDTEIGRIPKEWEVVNLGSIAKISSGNTAPQEEKYFKNGKYPFIRVQHLKELQEEKFPVNYDFVNDYALSELKLKLFKKGCIVFPKSGESIKLEKRAMLKEDSCVVNHLAVIEPLYENIDNLFLFYYLCTIKTSNYLTETTMPSLNLSTISNFLVPLPSLIEQQRIAEILSTVDKAIQKTNDIIAKTERLKKGLMQELLTKGIGHKEFKDTEIGKIPKEWEVVNLEGACVEITDGSHWSPKQVERSEYRIATVANLRETYIDIDSCKFISEEDYMRLVKEGDVPRKDDILFSKDGTVGITFTFKQDFYKIGLLSSIAIIRPNHEFLFSDFGAYALKSPNILMQITGWKTGTALRRITLDNLKRLKIMLPPLQEQQKIAEILSTVDKKLETLKQEKVKLERIKQWFMEELLSGRIRVRVA